MKRITMLAVMVFTMLVINLQAQTNTNQTILEQAGDAAKQVVATNINQVVVQMLSGVKDASGEIYGASKQALKGGVDFAMKEAPDVIHQFLVWKFALALIHWLAFLSVGICILYFGQRCKRWGQKNDDDAIGFGWVLTIVGIIIIIVNTSLNGMEMTKIGLAPKVYILEYVVDTVKEVTSHEPRR